jgi:thioredoxin-related protein
MAEVDAVRRSAYAALGDAPVPVSDANFARYGASSMPTIVVIDRAGKVALYHPGKMTYAELKPILAAAVRK